MRSTNIQRALILARIDLNQPPQQPSLGSLAVATVVALGASLAVDAVLVAIGTAIFPATRGYTHFRFSDYGLLTTIGVLVACAAWPLTARLSSAPRWLFLRLAIVVTLVLWLPDVWLLVRGQPPKAVAVLIVMHLAIGVVTYNALVRIALPKPSRLAQAGAPGVHPEVAGAPLAADDAAEGSKLCEGRAVWVSMLALVGLEFFLGVAALFVVPAGRPTGWLPRHGTPIYVLHTAVGAVLGVGAVVLVVAASHAERSARVSAVIGLAGVVLGAAGGVLTVDHAVRLLGMALMFVGSVAAAMGYLLPAIGPLEETIEEPPDL